MKRLHDKVNIIPLISKADTLTPDECREFKKTVSLLNNSNKKKLIIDEERNKIMGENIVYDANEIMCNYRLKTIPQV